MTGALPGAWRAMALSASLALALIAAPSPALTDGRSGSFDYYVLSLSWSPAWCAREGRERRAAQCDPARAEGFIVHGLWPQYERGGWPAFCRTAIRDPSRAETQAMADLMGSAALARHEWNKHGRCTGVDPADYFTRIREAARRIRRPPGLRHIAKPQRLPPTAVEAAFIKANPGLDPDEISVACADGLFREVRVCLTRRLTPRPCTGSVARDCPQPEMLVLPPRRK